jgi:hypothetical protein
MEQLGTPPDLPAPPAGMRRHHRPPPATAVPRHRDHLRGEDAHADPAAPAGRSGVLRLNDIQDEDVTGRRMPGPSFLARLRMVVPTDPDVGSPCGGLMETGSLLPYVYDRALNYRNPRVTNVYVDEYYGMIDFQALRQLTERRKSAD